MAQALEVGGLAALQGQVAELHKLVHLGHPAAVGKKREECKSKCGKHINQSAFGHPAAGLRQTRREEQERWAQP